MSDNKIFEQRNGDAGKHLDKQDRRTKHQAIDNGGRNANRGAHGKSQFKDWILFEYAICDELKTGLVCSHNVFLIYGLKRNAYLLCFQNLLEGLEAVGKLFRHPLDP